MNLEHGNDLVWVDGEGLGRVDADHGGARKGVDQVTGIALLQGVQHWTLVKIPKHEIMQIFSFLF